MARFLSHILNEEHFVLGAERTLFWERESTLIVADLHVGKTAHFRKAGISIPSAVYKDDLHRLLAQILFFKAERLIIVGDLSHSIANLEVDLFRKWRKDFSTLDVHLAKGNHDILDNKWYKEADITVHNDAFAMGEFSFVHDITQKNLTLDPTQFYFSGHVHPSITVRGRGKQALKFPCFYFNDHFCILPAFSRFTGSFGVRPQTGDKIFAVIEQDILLLNSPE